MKLLHVSDLHIGAGDNSKVDRLLTHLHTKYFGASDAYLLITGDIVDDGQAEQCQNAYELLRRFKGRLLVCLGNHDAGLFGNLYQQEAVNRFDSKLGTLLLANPPNYPSRRPQINVVGDVLLVGLNSCLPTPNLLDFACGRIGESQLSDLNAILNDPKYADHWKVVYLHHKPLKLKWYNWPFLRLVDKDKLMAIAGPKADVIAFGHSGSNSSELVKWPGTVKDGTHMLNADESLEQQSYFDVTITDKPSVEYCRVL